MIPPDRAPVERFRRSVGRLCPIASGERIALAVSGGADSMALLTLAAAAYPGQVVAATVDHGLRAASAGEAVMVADHAASIDIPHRTLRIAAPPESQDNVQAWARRRRYDLLTEWAAEAGAICLATAHHADDQAETFLMRAARGSGVAGLAGIRPLHRPTPAAPVALIRPLLDWRVADLRAVVTEQGVPFVDDPSNADPRYDRTRFRALLRGAPWIDPMHVARSAAYIAEADGALRAVEAWVWAARRLPPDRHPGPRDLQPQDAHHGGSRHEAGVAEGTTEAAAIRLDVADLPRELKRRLARTALHAVRAAAAVTQPDFTDSTNIEPLLDALETGKSATQGGVVVTVKGDVWRFAEQPPRRTA